jgi:ABC-2 type transport system ATP-binding protein/sodium transport system ATP-binding protein
LDEPTIGLDVLGSQVIVEYINLLKREGKAAIVTTHRLDEAERLCDRFGLMHRGRIVREGTLDELRTATECSSLVEMFLKLADVGAMLPGVAG